MAQREQFITSNDSVGRHHRDAIDRFPGATEELVSRSQSGECIILLTIRRSIVKSMIHLYRELRPRRKKDPDWLSPLAQFRSQGGDAGAAGSCPAVSGVADEGGPGQ